MNTKNNETGSIRRRILRFHAAFLFVLTIGATINTMVGWLYGKGVYALWHVEQFAAAGLYQAYLLMFVIAVTLWMGSRLEQADLWKWELIAILAHLIPLSVNFIFADLFAARGFGNVSMVSTLLHTIWISVELFALLYLGRSSLSTKIA